MWLLVNTCRMVLAMALLFSGVVKLIDPRGTEYKIRDYAAAFGLDNLMLFSLPLLLSVALALTEFGLGVNLLFGNNRRWTTRVVLLVFILFTPFTLYLALDNPVHDCGCFGDALVLTNWQSFAKNVVLLLCAIVVWRWYGMQTRFISEASQWMITLYSLLFAFILSLYCIYTLPVMDFRAYHIGADLHAGMQWDDTERVPPMADLFIMDPSTGEDVTDSVVSSAGWKFLVVIPRIEVADDGVMDKLAELTDYCTDNGYGMFALTAGSDSQINYWRDITGAEYPFLVADEIVLKTMVRSNPGVILLDGSVVVNKWAASQIPDATMLTAPLEQLEWARKERSTYWERASIMMVWYLFPLCLWTLGDRVMTAFNAYRSRQRKQKDRHAAS